MPPPKPGFLANAHLLRGVAIVLVVATHTRSTLPWKSEADWDFKVSLSLAENATVLFVLLAGLLFQHELHKFRYPDYLRRKFLYVVLPYVLVSLPELLHQHVSRIGIFAPRRFLPSDSVWTHAAMGLLSGADILFPLWFIPMICVLFLLAPVFALLDRSTWAYWLLPPLLLLSSLAHRPVQSDRLAQSIPYFLPVYFAGMWVSRYMHPILAVVARHRVALILFTAAAIAFEVLARERPGAVRSIATFSMENGVFGVNLFQKLAISVLLLDVLRSAGPLLTKVLDVLARTSFGIYLTHAYLLMAIRLEQRLGVVTLAGSIPALVACTLGIVLVCAGFSLALRRLLGNRSRYLIGS